MRYYTRKQVADLMQVCEETISRRVKEGTFPKPVKLGRRLNRWTDEQLAEHARRQLAVQSGPKND